MSNNIGERELDVAKLIPEPHLVAAGIDTAEQYANTGTIVELDGVHLANTLYGLKRRHVQRSLLSIPTGRLTVQREIPLFLT